MLDYEQHAPIVSNDARQPLMHAERQRLRLNENQRTAVEQIHESRSITACKAGGT